MFMMPSEEIDIAVYLEFGMDAWVETFLRDMSASEIGHCISGFDKAMESIRYAVSASVLGIPSVCDIGDLDSGLESYYLVAFLIEYVNQQGGAVLRSGRVWTHVDSVHEWSEGRYMLCL